MSKETYRALFIVGVFIFIMYFSANRWFSEFNFFEASIFGLLLSILFIFILLLGEWLLKRIGLIEPDIEK